MSECFKCGAEIRRRTSAYNPWDEIITVTWTPGSGDMEHLEFSDSGGKYPEKETRHFCSRSCLDAFIQMDYPLKPRDVDTDSERYAEDGGSR